MIYSLLVLYSLKRQIPVVSSLIVDPGFSDHGEEDVSRLAHDFGSLRGDLANDSESQIRSSREGMSADKLFVDLRLTTECPRFILEYFSQRLMQLQLRLAISHMSRETTRIVETWSWNWHLP